MDKKELKKKTLKAISKGGTTVEIGKYLPFRLWIYRHTTKKEREMSRALHETVIKNIFES